MYSNSIKLAVIRLRGERGYTFNEIQKRFPFLSKGTISEWTRDVVLNHLQKERIVKKQLKGRVGLLKYNEEKHRKAIESAKRIISEAKQEVGRLTKRDLLIAGAALYWGEGYNKSRHVIEVANSDPKIITLMMRFFREILEIDEKKFRCGLILHPRLDEGDALDFWSSVTGIPLSQFHKTYIKPPKSSTGKMHNILYRGTVKIRIANVKKRLRLKGLIEALGGG